MSKKYYLSLLFFLGFSLLITQNSMAQFGMLQKGDKAPVFTAKASRAGSEFNFSLEKALNEGPVVVYFFPSAYTGGCDLEAHTFSTHIKKFVKAGTTVIGVSADDIQRLNDFSSDPKYCAGNFPVASDPGGKIAASYGLKISEPVKGAKDVRGKAINHGFIPRTTFVINKNDKIVAVFSSKRDHIGPKQHVTKSLAIVQTMQGD